MSTQQSDEQIGSLSELSMIVDADGHVLEDIDGIFPYIDDRYEGVKKHMEHTKGPYNDVYTKGQPTPPHYEMYGGADWYGDDGDPVSEAKYKLKIMSDFEIDYSVLNPTLNLALNTVNNKRYAAALANGYNSWVIDVIDGYDALKANILVAPKVPERSAEEVEHHADEDSFCGVVIPPGGMLPPPGDDMYDPIYEAAQRHGLPIIFHSGSGAINMFPNVFNWSQTYAAYHTLAHPFQQMWTLTDLLYRGIPERFPDLSFIIQEAGVGYIPYITWRLDDHYMDNPDDVPYLSHLPSKYIEDRFYFTTQPLGHTARDPTDIANAIEMAGAESIMYSADLPHPDFDTPNELFDRVQSQFAPDIVRGMMGETAAELYDLG